MCSLFIQVWSVSPMSFRGRPEARPNGIQTARRRKRELIRASSHWAFAGPKGILAIFAVKFLAIGSSGGPLIRSLLYLTALALGAQGPPPAKPKGEVPALP